MYKKEKTLNTEAPHLKMTLCVAGKKMQRIEIFLLYCKRKESKFQKDDGNVPPEKTKLPFNWRFFTHYKMHSVKKRTKIAMNSALQLLCPLWSSIIIIIIIIIMIISVTLQVIVCCLSMNRK